MLGRMMKAKGMPMDSPANDAEAPGAASGSAGGGLLGLMKAKGMLKK